MTWGRIKSKLCIVTGRSGVVAKKPYVTRHKNIKRSQLFIMEIVTIGAAGTMESSDIIVRIEPSDREGIELHLESAVMQQFGNQIRKVILETLESLGVKNATVNAVDKGALDCTIAARVSAAAFRAAKSEDFTWVGGRKECHV